MLTKGPKTKHKRRQQTGFAKRWGRAKPPKLPELMKPDGAGDMPLSFAVQWIATHGGTLEINPLDEGLWREAFKDLRDHIASGDVKVVGERPDGVSEDISGAHFASCSVDYPFSDRRVLYNEFLGNEFCLVLNLYLDDEHWRHDFDDRLVNRHGLRWRRLQVLKADVARSWPFGKSQDRRTGAPGPTQPGERTPRKLPLRERAQRALDELYPDGVPDNQITKSNAELVSAVGAHLAAKRETGLSRDTILRAAGRRK